MKTNYMFLSWEDVEKHCLSIYAEMQRLQKQARGQPDVKELA